MKVCLWYPLGNLTDAWKLYKTVEVMRSAVDLMALDNADEVVEIPKTTARVMVDMLESTAELVLDIAHHLDQKQGGNVQRYNCQCKEGAE